MNLLIAVSLDGGHSVLSVPGDTAYSVNGWLHVASRRVVRLGLVNQLGVIVRNQLNMQGQAMFYIDQSAERERVNALINSNI